MLSVEALAGHPGLQFGELPPPVALTRVDLALVVASHPRLAHHDRGEGGPPRATVGVPIGRNNRASGDILAGGDAYLRAPSSTRITSIPGVIGGAEGNQGEVCA